MQKLIITLLFLLPLMTLYSQTTIHVPGDYPTIQAAIDAATNGDMVLVAEDTYYENINYEGKAITVASHFLIDGDETHIENTIIDGSQPIYPDSASVVSFFSGEDTTSVLCGFTITGGTGTIGQTITRAGGGIAIYLSGATICNNIIEFNSIDSINAFGGGIYAGYNNIVIIKNNIIRNNIVVGTYPLGGGISLQYSGLTYISSNKIVDNKAIGTNASGGGIDLNTSNDELIINSNLIKGNDTQLNGYGGGGIDLWQCEAPVTVSNNLIVDNIGYRGGGVLVDYPVSGASKPVPLCFGNYPPKKEEANSSELLLETIPILVNNTIIYNSAYWGGGIYGYDTTPDIMNCIVWGNTATSGYQIGGTVNVVYSDIQGGWTGEGNIDCNPGFLDTTYFLLSDSSCCIDTGNPDPMYNDVEDPNNLGFALYPAKGTLRNDMGTYGGPNSTWWSEISNTIYVPGDYTSIQKAIDAAIDGNVVLVADGNYYENINYKGKAITVASHFLVDGDTSHISNTIIDGSQPSHPDSGSVVSFFNDEEINSVLCGFTITGGTGTYTLFYDDKSGGGIFLNQTGATIRNNIIQNNSINYTEYVYGGGIFIHDTTMKSSIIIDNVIKNNTCNASTSAAAGGGIFFLVSGIIEILNNKIIDNSVSGPYTYGGGIDCNGRPTVDIFINSNYIKGNESTANNYGGGGIDIWNCSAIVKNNLILENYAAYGGGGILVIQETSTSSKSGKNNIKRLSSLFERLNSSQHSSKVTLTESLLENNTIVNNTALVGGGFRSVGYNPELINCIVWGNDAQNGPQIYGTADVQYSDVEGGWSGTGNTNEDPNFDDSTYFVLNYHSSCIDAGNPVPIYNDVENPQNLGYALLPARGTLVNDMGHFGGPGSLWSTWDIPVSVKDDDSEIGIPSEYILSQNYPNPFNPTTTIKYGLRERTMVELRVFDILGREVISLVNEEQPAGYYEIEFNANRLASGIYFYRLQAGPFVETKKMMLLK